MFGFSLVISFFLASIQLVKLSMKQSNKVCTVNMNCSEMKVRFKRMYIVLLILIVFGSLQSFTGDLHIKQEIRNGLFTDMLRFCVVRQNRGLEQLLPSGTKKYSAIIRQLL